MKNLVEWEDGGPTDAEQEADAVEDVEEGQHQVEGGQPQCPGGNWDKEGVDDDVEGHPHGSDDVPDDIVPHLVFDCLCRIHIIPPIGPHPPLADACLRNRDFMAKPGDSATLISFILSELISNFTVWQSDDHPIAVVKLVLDDLSSKVRQS